MIHTIITTNHTVTASLIERKDGYSIRYWTIRLSADIPLCRGLKRELALAFGMEAALTSFESLVNGVLKMREDLMN